MPKKPKFELSEVMRRDVPEAIEFQVARAAVEWERACRLIDGTHGKAEVTRHADAHLKLRRLASQLIED